MLLRVFEISLIEHNLQDSMVVEQSFNLRDWNQYVKENKADSINHDIRFQHDKL